VAPPIDVEPAAPVDPAEPVARYTWPEIRARVAEPDKASLATYRVAVAPKRLVEEGSLIASERILTDLRIWLGQIIDWWAALSPAERGLVEGFSEARLRVVTHHAFVLQDLLARAAKKHAASKHAAAVAIANDVYRQAQAARVQLRAVLDQAAHAELGFAEAVATADAAASDEVALHATLGALIELAEKTLQQGGPVAAVLEADGFGAASKRGVPGTSARPSATRARPQPVRAGKRPTTLPVVVRKRGRSPGARRRQSSALGGRGRSHPLPHGRGLALVADGLAVVPGNSPRMASRSYRGTPRGWPRGRPVASRR